MGGSGSGTWYRWQGRKATVDESLAISTSDLRQRLFAGAAGSLAWGRRGRSTSIGYALTEADGRLVVTLTYRWNHRRDVRLPVALTTTPTRYGGPRYWFFCPLGVCANCIGRVWKLYLPPGSRYFGCRHCHDLTYRSSQEAHRAERLFRPSRFAADLLKFQQPLGEPQ